MPPADESFECDDLVATDGKDRLIEHLELLFGYRGAQIHLQQAARLNPGVHLRLKETAGAAAGALGALKGHIGPLQKLILPGFAARRKCDPEPYSPTHPVSARL